MKWSLRGLLLLLVLLLSSPCSALVIFDFEQMYFFEKNYRVKDHCFVKIDTLYHLYYIRAPLAPDGPQFEDSLGHAISTDLIHWTILPPVISVQPGTWENEAVWAPHVIQGLDMKYYMFYTGVNSSIAQATGLATSTDGFTWIKWPGNPVYIPDTTWAQWSTNSWSDCRDPFIFFENGLYYMLITTKSKTGQATIACATSTDLVNWTDRGPICAHEGRRPADPMESPFLVKKFNKYHLFFSVYEADGTSYLSSDSLLSGWDFSERTLVDRGGGAEVFGVEQTQLFSRYKTFNVQRTEWYAVKIDTLLWENGLPVVRINHPLSKDWLIVSGTAFTTQPTFGDNTFLRSGITSGLEGNCWVGTYEKFMGPLQPAGAFAGDSQGDKAIGELRSRSFMLEGSTINLLVGGGYKPDSAFVALCDGCDDAVIFSETGKNSETMDLRTWDVSQMRGRWVYLKIVDASTTAFGHINVDNIVETGQGLDWPEGPPVTVTRPNGGELWEEGTRQSILWKVSSWNANPIGTVSISLTTNGGRSYVPIATDVSSRPPFYCILPNTPSDFCRVRVTFKNEFARSCDESDQNFTIVDKTPPSVSVLPPSRRSNVSGFISGSDTLFAGNPAVISWVTQDNGTIDSTGIYLSVDGGNSYPYCIISGYRYSSPYVWRVLGISSDNCRIKICAFDHGLNVGTGESSIFKIIWASDVSSREASEASLGFSLGASPNPFGRSTTVSVSLPSSRAVRVDVFNVNGDLVKTLFSGQVPVGKHSIVWDGTGRDGANVPSGIYLVRAASGSESLMRKIVLLR
ncbi:MAG: FlgD immunoglobulin-like domain containing protein [Candidatus Eisenbacteria bacterium]|nr:FlgD immunoglobulin-like domain containing protein [Candidatus Eisenbacteria bacterium]